MGSDQQNAADLLARHVRVDKHTTSIDLVELGLLNRVAAGELAHTSAMSFDQAVTPASLLDERFVVTRSASSDTAVAVLAERADAAWALQVNGSTSTLLVGATTNDAANELAHQLAARVTIAGGAGRTTVRVWHRGPFGSFTTKDRDIDAPDWNRIARNYPSPVRRQLDELLGLVRPSGMAKLILWHGEPGTGKTTAARALFRSWADWCAVEYVNDPEHFLADPGYISDVISRPPRHSPRPTFDRIDEHDTRRRVIVAEDADDYLRAGSGSQRSTDLSRLLNLADGVLGQGVNSLILLTTNEPLDALHPALVRPGRALARIGFTRFSPGEGAEWLGEPDQTGLAELTLAELYHRQRPANGLGVSDAPRERVGQYL